LAYDGSLKAREALFVAAYLAEQLKMSLVVASVSEAERVTDTTLEYARQYLELHEVQATYIQTGGPVTETLLKTAEDHASDLLIMGGHGHSPIMEVVLGSTVDHVLRDSRWPMLICK
jgi:nucleotide-binding universal stress UspA family protein